MDLQDNKTHKKTHPLWKSFYFAISGIMSALKKERNFQIHVAAAIVAICLSIYFSLSVTEWILILLSIGGVFALELINSAIERVVDLVTMDYHPLAKQAKDFAAGAVLIYAIVAVLIGLLVFLPKILRIL